MNTKPQVKKQFPPQIRDGMVFQFACKLKELADGFDGNGLMKSCLTCQHFDEATEVCKKFQERPPARVIVSACEHYCDLDEIPF